MTALKIEMTESGESLEYIESKEKDVFFLF